MTVPRTLRSVVLAALALAVVLVASSACSALRAGRLLGDALQPPPELLEEVTLDEVDVPTRDGPVRVLLARPADETGPLPAIVLVHGAVDVGARERRFLAFVRAFAARGMVVAAPHLSALAGFEMAPSDPPRVADVGRWLVDQGEAEDDHVALAGVSVGASYALVAADDPALRDHVSAVLSFGGYADLEALLLRWMTQPAGQPGDLFDPLTEGRRMVLLGNAGHLVAPDERSAVEARLRAILEGRPEPRGDLSVAAEEVVAVARSAEPLAPGRADALLRRMADPLATLSPARDATPRAPVYLLHGAGDPVVPPEDLDVLARSLRSRGVDVETHLTELFDHVDARESPGLLESWPLLRFIGAFLDDAGL